jgi:pimeloyl-ACP methyl ester carboxylesterase
VRAARLLPVSALAVALAACSSSAGTVEVVGTAAGRATPSATTAPASSAGRSVPPTSTAPTSSLPVASLDWEDCGDNLDCATLEVPLDYDDPTGPAIELALMRRPADLGEGRTGSLLVNPGGPGVPGTTIPEAAELYLSEDLLDHFDIVGWDPRGTGASSHVDCDDNLDPYFTLDPTPDTPEEKQALIDAAKDFAARCEAKSGELLPHISTVDSARDMEQIRRALGEDEISYLGFSYGSELGATFATLYPESVRAMVLDGAVDPNSDVIDESRRQVASLERSLDAFLADCASRDKCPFRNGGDPGAALDAILADLEDEPLELEGREIGQGIAYTAIVSALYDRGAWPILAESLARAQQGDATGLAYLFDQYVERDDDGTYANTFEALIAINCLDDPGPTDVGFPDQLAPEFRRLAPRLGEASAYGYYCTFWPARPTETLTVTGAGAGPIVVVGTTGDAITPLESSQRLAEALEEGVLVTVDAERHTGYGENDCITAAVDDYLVDVTVPAAGLVC